MKHVVHFSYKSFLLMFHHNLSKPSGTDLTFDMWEKQRESRNQKKKKKASKKKTSKASRRKSNAGRRSSDLSLTRYVIIVTVTEYYIKQYRPLAQLLSTHISGAGGLGFNSRAGQIGTVSPTARHPCDVSAELRYSILSCGNWPHHSLHA